MTLQGTHLIAGVRRKGGTEAFRAVDPRTGATLAPPYADATAAELDSACRAAVSASDALARAEDRANLLDGIALEIEDLGDALVDRADAETALGRARLESERARTCDQLRLLAAEVRDGRCCDARIDRGNPSRTPTPRPDLRRMLVPIGPVAVFGASNFPLAFSVAGGDTASALAAGCPVVVKAHPGHPGSSELVAGAVARAVEGALLAPGVFSLVHGAAPEVGLALVRHPHVRAVGFTGSLRAGRALYDAAAARPDPIPVHAEMGSINPVFVLPGAARERGAAIAEGYVASATLGVGQFCTKPGILAGVGGNAFDELVDAAAAGFESAPPASMLGTRLLAGFASGCERVTAIAGVGERRRARVAPDPARTEAAPLLLAVDGSTFLAEPALAEEVFGPASVVVSCADAAQLEAVARALPGQLTVTIHATDDDLATHASLIRTLLDRAGRVVFNGFPTGVEVGHAMQHGGPYPATTDARFTSVGTAAIARFARPVCFQNSPAAVLPPELRDENPRGIWRLVDGELTRAPI